MSSTTLASPQPTLRDLREDDRGAVMMMGICMALFLIGAMWVVAGIGDAIVYRDRLQEVADHVAFTSASVHARGMNLVSALNLIMFAATALHILMGLTVLTLRLVGLIPVISGFAQGAATVAFNIWNTYYRFMRPVQKGVGVSSKVVAYAYPYAGQIAGITTAADYGEVGLSMSASMIPGSAINLGINATGANNLLGRLPPVGPPPGQRSATTSPIGGATSAPQLSDSRLALPVSETSMAENCSLVARYTLDWIFGLAPVKAIRDFGAFGVHPFRSALDAVVEPIAQGLRDIYCNANLFDTGGIVGKIANLFKESENESQKKAEEDAAANNGTAPGKPPSTADKDAKGEIQVNGTPGASPASLLPPIGIITIDSFWDEKGPKTMWAGAANDSDWTQVWAWALGGNDQDTSVRRIKLAQQDYGGANENVTYPAFDAQAEFYYDCTAKWADEDCNHGNRTRATYNMKWRARLRRFRNANLAGMAATVGAEAIFNGSVLNYIRGGINNSGAVARLESRFQNGAQSQLRSLLGGANGAGGQLGKLTGMLKGQLRGGTNPSTDSYH